MSIYLKEPPSVLKILFQIGTLDMTTGEAIKNELKVAISFEYFYKQPSSNDKISYNIISLINHYGNLLDFVHYVKWCFWWQHRNLVALWLWKYHSISNLPKGFYCRESHKKTKKYISGSTDVLLFVYIITSHLKKHSYIFFNNSQPCPKSLIWRK